MSMLNRRNALTAAATLPALAVPAAVARAMPDASEHKLRALEMEIYQAWEHLGSVLEILGEAETRLHDWKKANPKPEMRAQTQEEIQTLYRCLMNGKGEASYSAEYEQDLADHKRALAAWETRHEAAKEETGENRAHELENAAGDRLDDAIDTLCNTPATTIEGLRCKARAKAKVEDGDGVLAWSIVEDLAEPASAVA